MFYIKISLEILNHGFKYPTICYALIIKSVKIINLLLIRFTSL